MDLTITIPATSGLDIVTNPGEGKRHQAQVAAARAPQGACDSRQQRRARARASAGQAQDNAPFVIYSANEAAVNDGAGFWSNADGWVEDPREASRFSAQGRARLSLPMSTGQDAAWVRASEVGA